MNVFEKLGYRILRNRTIRRIIFSFSFRLAILDLKKNLSLLAFWAILFGMVTKTVATTYGVPYLFLEPEYFHKTNALSFFVVGFACGGFIIAYNISSFIKNADRFPFLASLRFPFMKYCLNNFLLPTLFVIVYSIQVYYFLKSEESMTELEIILALVALVGGVVSFLFLTFAYFFSVSKDIFKMFGVQFSEDLLYGEGKDKITGERNPKLVKESRDWYVETYFSAPFRVRLVRSVHHYKKEMIMKVVAKNRHNAFVYQMFSLFSLIGFGYLGEIEVFQIPAGASIFLLFTLLVMLFSSLYRWFGGWSTIIFIGLFLLFNYSYKFDLLAVDRIYGLNYNGLKADYSISNFQRMDERYDLVRKDIDKTLGILNKWKIKNTDPAYPNKKPKMVFINCTGGGLRSTMWTFFAMQHIDSLVGGNLLKQTQLISGSSGGMVGAAYLRELYLQKQKGEIESFYGDKYLKRISKDMLNPISFKIATSEWFFSMKHFELDGNFYPKDRAYAFEKALNENTDSVFANKRLYDYIIPEKESKIPMMIFSPSILNDGRKLLVSSQNISYLTQNIATDNIVYQQLTPTIEYLRFFQNQGAINTVFTSAIRMSATFPYISPSASLPSEPSVEIIDAGFRDNFGLESSLRFIRTFNDWIKENTSGVVIVQFRDKAKVPEVPDQPALTLLQALARPVGSCYSNLFTVQDYNQNEQIQMADIWSKTNIEIISLELHNVRNDKISLNWHLTGKEKAKVLGSIRASDNVKAIRRLREILE